MNHERIMPTEKITIEKSDYEWDKKYPYIVRHGDLRASFNSLEKAKEYARHEMPYKYLTTDATGTVKDTRRIK